MKKIEIKITERKKSIIFINFPVIKAGEKLSPLSKNFLVISDENVYNLYGKILRESFSDQKTIHTFILKPGEKEKTFKNVEKILRFIAGKNFSRDDTIIGLGGGVISDLAGFVSSIYMRGINFAIIPTTLLSQVDASIGGKTGVNFYEKKNLVGSFYQPLYVFMDFKTLETLPDREMKQGIAEIIKYGVIKNKRIFELLEKNKNKIKNALPEIIEECIKIKAEIVTKDEKEKKGLREILNFGHTIGHAIELLSEYNLNHGEAVANGMIYESYIAYKLGLCSREVYTRIKKVINDYNFPLIEGIIDNVDKVVENLKYDKKVRMKQIRFVLPERIGKVKSGVVVPIEDIIKLLKEKQKNE